MASLPLVEVTEVYDESDRRISGDVRALDDMVDASSQALRDVALQLKEVIEKKGGSGGGQQQQERSEKKKQQQQQSAPPRPETTTTAVAEEEEKRSRDLSREFDVFRSRLEELERLEERDELEAKRKGLGSNWKRGFLDKGKKTVSFREDEAVPERRRPPPTSEQQQQQAQVREEKSPSDDTEKQPLAFGGCVGRVKERSSKAPTHSTPPIIVEDEFAMPQKTLSRFKRLQLEEAQLRSGGF